MVVEWEYKVVYIDANQHTTEEEEEAWLNKLGKEGWELIQGLFDPPDRDVDQYFFKRPRRTIC